MIKQSYWLPKGLSQAKAAADAKRLEPPLVEGVVCSACGWIGILEDRNCYLCGEALVEQKAPTPFIQELSALESLPFKPLEHQLYCALRVLGQMHGVALLCDEVGLGKTIEAGLIARELIIRKLASSILILVPASLLLQWMEELLLKFGIQAVLIRNESDWADHASLCNPMVYLISHELARRPAHYSHIQAAHWDLLIVDEAHKLKNRKTILHRLMKSVFSTYRLLLTATPIQNNLIELYNLVSLVDEEHFGSLQDFKADFIEGRDSRSPKNVLALRRSLQDVMIRQTRMEARVNWVSRRAGVIEIEMTEQERLLYQKVTQYIRTGLKDAKAGKNLLTLLLLQKEVSSSPQALASTLAVMAQEESKSEQERQILLELYQLADAIGVSEKIRAIVQLVRSSSEKFLIFSDYVQTVKALRNALTAAGVSVGVFHGGLSLQEKEQVIQEFRLNVQVLLSTESGSEGRNLQFCHQLINADLPWNPMKLEQRIGRVHRLGQTHDVSIYTVVAQETIETYILELLAKKIRLFELVVGELDLILGNLDRKRSLEELLIEIWKQSQTDEELKEGFERLGGKATRARRSYKKLKQVEAAWFTESINEK